MHWLFSSFVALESNIAAASPVCSIPTIQDVVLSLNQTPRSRASCSNVTGRNEPAYGLSMTKTIKYLKLTNSTNSIDFSRKRIAIPTSNLPLRCLPCIFARIAGSTEAHRLSIFRHFECELIMEKPSMMYRNSSKSDIVVC